MSAQRVKLTVECLLVLLRVSHCWSICTDYCSIPVLCQRDSHSHNLITDWMWNFCQLCHNVPLYCKAYSSFSPLALRLACHSNRRYTPACLDFQTHEIVSHNTAMSILYLTSSIATSAVRLSGLLVVPCNTVS